mgnify:CR=1 FL=1
MTGTQGLMIKTDLEIKEWDHENSIGGVNNFDIQYDLFTKGKDL